MSEKLHQWIRSAGLIGIAISLAALAWVQCQGVRAERHHVVAQMILQEQAVRLYSQYLLFAVFSIEEICDNLYSLKKLSDTAAAAGKN